MKLWNIQLVALSTLAACSQPTVSQIGRDCGSDVKPFVEYWPCQRPRLSAEIKAPDDIKQNYLATGDAVAEKIKAGQLTDAEGRLVMARAYSEAVNANDARQRAPGIVVENRQR